MLSLSLAGLPANYLESLNAYNFTHRYTIKERIDSSKMIFAFPGKITQYLRLQNLFRGVTPDQFSACFYLASRFVAQRWAWFLYKRRYH